MPSRRHGLKAVFVTHSPAHRAAVSSDVRAGGASGAFDHAPFSLSGGRAMAGQDGSRGRSWEEEPIS